MEFLKKHYEKILLSVVLLILAGTAAWFPMKIGKEREEAQTYSVDFPPPKAYKQIDLTTNLASLQRLQSPPVLKLSGGHNLFNPVTWKHKPDGTFQKIVSQGVDALVATKIVPLYFEISYERPSASGYWIGVRHLSAKSPTRVYAKINEKKPDMFTIKNIAGETNDPTELVLELADSNEMVTISKDKPYQKVEAYAVDLRYEPDNLTFPNKRVNEVIAFGGESYKIIAITENDVRVEAISTNKRTTIAAMAK